MGAIPVDPCVRGAFAELLRRHRLAAGLTQQELAERSGVSTRSVSDLEREISHHPRRDTAAMLADGLVLSGAGRDAFLGAARSGPRALPTPPQRAVYPPLPEPADALLGRKQELRAIEEAFTWQGVRLLTLTGPGGVGKTRLAIEAARQLAGWFNDGVVFVRLDGLNDPALVLPTLAAALQLMESGGAQSLLDRVTAHLATRTVLVVLDNFEHVLEAGPEITGLLARAVGARMLVTSRESLRVSGEQVFNVAPLPRPDPDSWQRPATLLSGGGSPAVRLFVQRALAARPDLVIDPESEDGTWNLAVIAETCHRLDGLPLAIELAAAQAQVLTPAAILSLLKNAGLPLLAAGGRDQPARLQTMDAAIAWSYNLLTADEQALFRALSVFAGGFSLPAAEYVGGAPSVLSGIVSLARQNLLLEDTTAPAHAAPRFRMLEPLRLFALDRLRAAGEEQTVRLRHAEFFVQTAETLDALTLGPDLNVSIEQQVLDLDNLRAAQDWALAAGEHLLAVLVTAHTAQLWLLKGHLAEGRHRVAAAMAVDAACAPGDRWFLRFWAASFAFAEGNLAAATVHAHLLLEVAEADGDRVGMGAGLIVLSRVTGASPDGHEEAAALARRAVETLEPLGQDEWTGGAWGRLGIENHQLGLLEEARDCLLQSLKVRRRMGCEGCGAYSLATLGAVYLDLGRAHEAVAAYRECLELTSKHGNQSLLLAALIGLADVARRCLKEPDRGRSAALFFGAAEALRGRHGIPWEPAARELVSRWQLPLRRALGDAEVDALIDTGMALSVEKLINLARHLDVTDDRRAEAALERAPSLLAAIGSIE